MFLEGLHAIQNRVEFSTFGSGWMILDHLHHLISVFSSLKIPPPQKKRENLLNMARTWICHLRMCGSEKFHSTNSSCCVLALLTNYRISPGQSYVVILIIYITSFNKKMIRFNLFLFLLRKI